jgi:hypothetical protein
MLVSSFTFPGDWHKIRQMMKTRRAKEKLNEEIVNFLRFCLFILFIPYTGWTRDTGELWVLWGDSVSGG